MSHNYPTFDENVKQMRVYHKEHNYDKKHNCEDVPEVKALFGIFDFVSIQTIEEVTRDYVYVDKPLHCRYVGMANNLREAVVAVYKQTDDTGLKTFMNGPWVKMVCFKEIGNVEETVALKEQENWINTYKPANADDGEYKE